MKCHWLVMAAWLLTAAIAGCGQSRTGDRVPADVSQRQLEWATVCDRVDPSDKRIVAFVSWLKSNGVTLEYAKNAEGDGGRWRVTLTPGRNSGTLRSAAECACRTRGTGQDRRVPFDCP